jgi:hypothetical protein
MNTVPTRCPICGGSITISRIYCRECDTTIEGHFVGHPFTQLRPEQLAFIETFIRCEGRIKRMEDELKLSYPTIRKQLQDVIRALGYEPSSEEPAGANAAEERRHQVLEDLEQGRITYQEAMSLLQESEA